MISLDSEQACLLELLKANFFDVSPIIPEDTNWESVYKAAKMQCIVPLISSRIPGEYKNEWLEVSFQSKAHFMQMIYEQNCLVSLFKDNEIPFVILKGTSAAIYYPIPSLRSFGDIDIYISEEYLITAQSLLEEKGYQFIKTDESEYVYVKNGISIELHIKITGTYYKDIEKTIINGLNNAVEYSINNCRFPGLPSYENGISLLGHIMHHLKSYGIGLRQIIDWMMYVHNELDDCAWTNHFRSLAEEAGLDKLAINVTFMCKKWLGLPDDITWCKSADEDVADQLLVRILNDGNFGCDRAPYENIRISIKNEGLFSHLQTSGIANWRLAQKHAVFKPFAWLYQICRYACIGIASLFTGKKVFKKDKQNLNLEELWRRLE